MATLVSVLWHAGSKLSTADAVTRWVQDHPLLHTVEEGPNTPPALSPHLVNTDAEAQLALLRPIVQSAVVQ